MQGVSEKEERALVSLLAEVVGKPWQETVTECDLGSLFALAKFHKTEATVYPVVKNRLEDGKLKTAWEKAYSSAKDKALAFKATTAEVLSALGERGVRALPLKGESVGSLYPKPAVRQFADADILFEDVGENRAVVEEVMLSLGFTLSSRGAHHDQYVLPPFFNFELHFALFDYGVFLEYYKNAFSRVEKTGGGYVFSKEDEYVYFLAHYFKHFTMGGAGLRSLVDLYLYNAAYSKSFDRAYVDREIEKLSLAAFEETMLSVARTWFERGDFFAVDGDLRQAILSAGAYGTIKTFSDNFIKAEGKYAVIKYVFPSADRLKTGYPVLKKAPFLLPFIWFWRILKRVFSRSAWKRLALIAKKGAKKGKTEEK